MKLLIGGQWAEAVSGRQEDVTSPFDGSVVGSVSLAGLDDVDAALAAATEGAKVWRRTPAHQRMRILLQAAALADERAEAIAQTISAEAGKAITEARGEASRSGELIRLAAFEGTQLYGDSLAAGREPGNGFRQGGLHGAPAGRSGRGHHALQLSVAAGAAQGRAGPGCRQRGGAQAGSHDAVDGPGPGRVLRRRRAPRGGAVRADGSGRRPRGCAGR